MEKNPFGQTCRDHAVSDYLRLNFSVLPGSWWYFEAGKGCRKMLSEGTDGKLLRRQRLGITSPCTIKSVELALAAKRLGIEVECPQGH
jgi:hypothetical protein